MSNQLWIPTGIVERLLTAPKNWRTLSPCHYNGHDQASQTQHLRLVNLSFRADRLLESRPEIELVIRDESDRLWLAFLAHEKPGAWKAMDIDGWGGEHSGLSCFREAMMNTVIRYDLID